MKITLTPEIESELTQQARQKGTTPEKLALETLRERFASKSVPKTPSKNQKTLADFLAGYIGVLSSSEYVVGGARMSERCGKKFASGLLKKREQGKL